MLQCILDCYNVLQCIFKKFQKSFANRLHLVLQMPCLHLYTFLQNELNTPLIVPGYPATVLAVSLLVEYAPSDACMFESILKLCILLIGLTQIKLTDLSGLISSMAWMHRCCDGINYFLYFKM